MPMPYMAVMAQKWPSIWHITSNKLQSGSVKLEACKEALRSVVVIKMEIARNYSALLALNGLH